AEPSFHKKSFLKPSHKTAEVCSPCHKVELPVELNFYKEFLRGQNHYDTHLLTVASGVGVRSFYYPPQARTDSAGRHIPPPTPNAAGCHRRRQASNDFGPRDFAGTGGLQVPNHRFLAANTGAFSLLLNDPRYESQRAGLEKAIKAHADFLTGTDPEGKDKKLR